MCRCEGERRHIEAQMLCSSHSELCCEPGEGCQGLWREYVMVKRELVTELCRCEEDMMCIEVQLAVFATLRNVVCAYLVCLGPHSNCE